MKILVTGICGFVGSTVAKAWLEAEPGLEVIGLDNLDRPGSEQNRIILKKLGVRMFHGDIRASSDFESLPPTDWVIDTAARPGVLSGIDNMTSSRQLIEHNLLGTVNILEYCRKHSAGFILISTSRVYSIAPLSSVFVEQIGESFHLAKNQVFPSGLSNFGVSENFSTSPPVSLYGSTKLASELLALEYGETFGFPVWINRCGVLAGAGQFGMADQGIFAFWINSWLCRRPLTYIGFGGKGHQVRDCLHPRDLVSLLKKQTDLEAQTSIRVVNLGGGSANAISLAELSLWCKERFGEHIIASNPETRRFDVPWLVMDSRLAGDVWGWRPETALEDILEEIARHAEQNPGWLEISGAV